VTCWGDHSVGQTTPPNQTFTSSVRATCTPVHCR
jgi:hypothetical protein